MENENSSSEKFSMMPDAMPRISLDEMLTCLENYLFERIGVRDDDKNASNRLHEIDHHLAQWFCRHGVELVCDRPDNISANNPNIAEQQSPPLLEMAVEWVLPALLRMIARCLRKLGY